MNGFTSLPTSKDREDIKMEIVGGTFLLARQEPPLEAFSTFL